MPIIIALSPLVIVPLFIYAFGIPMKDVVTAGLMAVPSTFVLVALHKWDIRRRQKNRVVSR